MSASMELSLLLVAFLISHTCANEVRSMIEESNKVSRGVQTFENFIEPAGEADGRTKSPPRQYTVYDWRKYYPFGGKLDQAGYNGTNTGGEGPGGGGEFFNIAKSQIVVPVYVRVPVRVPVKMSHVYPKKVPTMAVSASVRVPKTVHPPSRFFKVTRVPNHGSLPGLPIRRKYFAYYKPGNVIHRRPKLIKSSYHKVGIHDLNKSNTYYPLRGQGYEVTEIPVEASDYPRGWYSTASINRPF